MTVNVHGLSLNHRLSDGMSTATLPDVCLTPGAGPVPYLAYSRDLAKGTTTVFADGADMCATFGSEFSRSTGDEPGTGGGVTSRVNTREATWMTYSFDVKLEGKGACRLTDKMFRNHQNTVNMGGRRRHGCGGRHAGAMGCRASLLGCAIASHLGTQTNMAVGETVNAPANEWSALRPSRAVILLSLDVARPFLADIGLAAAGAFDWTACLRQFVRQHRASIAGGSRPSEPVRAAEIVAFVGAHLAPAAGRVFDWWLRHVYAEATTDHLAYRVWEDVLRHALRHPGGGPPLALPPRVAASVPDRFAASTTTRAFNSRWEQATAEPLSDWDLHMYAINGWNDDLPDLPNGPESQLYLIDRDYRGRTFWDALVATLSADEQQRSQEAAQRLVETTPDLAYVGVLPRLAALRMEWP